MKHHPQLKSKNALCFDSLCDDGCTVSNITQMYDQVYEAMVHSNVAIKLDDPPRRTILYKVRRRHSAVNTVLYYAPGLPCVC
jgi:hypothetical protein